MKRLDFPAATDDLDLFTIAYVGLNNPEAKLSVAELRTHGKILDKFEAIAVHQDDGSGFKLPAGQSGTVVLEDAELTLAKRLIESMHWLPVASRRVVKLIDLLESAPEYLVVPPTETA